MTAPVLRVEGLTTRFDMASGVIHAVEDVSYAVEAGSSVAIVGESGSGKSVSALSLLGLVQTPGRVVGGRVTIAGRDVLGLSRRAWRDVRGREIAMVFQDPMTSLNPVLTIGYQMCEGMRRHLGLSRPAARAEAERLLDLVGIPGEQERLARYPHELSGGQRQRVMIAMALSCEPLVLIADEPTTALDVTIQDQIVHLVKGLQAELGMGIVWITHDLALVAGLVDRVLVMYAGSIVEDAPVEALYGSAAHPYTRGLLASMPSVDGGAGWGGTGAGGDREPAPRLHVIEGRPPDLREAFRRCPFMERCPHAIERCGDGRPRLEPVGPSHTVACWRRGEL